MQIQKHTDEFKKAIFLLNTLFIPTIRLSKEDFFINVVTLTDDPLQKHIRALESIIYDILGSDILPELSSAYHKIPDSFEDGGPDDNRSDDNRYDSRYWESQENFGKLINKEYKSAGSPTYPLPDKIMKIVSEINSIRQGKSGSKILQELYPVNDSLTVFSTGQIEFYSSQENKLKETRFKTGSNGYKLIRYLAKNANHTFTYDELDAQMNEPGPASDSASPEMRVRNTIKDIRKKLGLSKDEMFHADYGFFINCKVILK